MSISSNTIIFVRLPNWVGDVCMSLPSLKALIDSKQQIVVCAQPWAKDLLAAYEIYDFIPMRKSWLDNAKSIRQWLKQHNYKTTLGLLLPDSLSSALAFRLAGIKCLGYCDDGRSLLLKWPIKKPKTKPHAVKSWYQLTYTALSKWQLNLPQPEPGPSLDWHPGPEHQSRVEQVLAETALKRNEFILIAPTATGLHKGQIKVWPYFDSLCQALQQHGYTVIMAPPKSEQDAALVAAPTAKLIAPISLGAFTLLTSYAKLVICNDSGVSHLAASIGARQITLFGVTDPMHTGPWSEHAVKLGTMGSWPNADTVISTTLGLLKNQ